MKFQGQVARFPFTYLSSCAAEYGEKNRLPSQGLQAGIGVPGLVRSVNPSAQASYRPLPISDVSDNARSLSRQISG